MLPGSFGETPQVTPAPTSIPQVDVPLPSFYTVGEQAAKGAKDAGLFSGIWEGLANSLGDIFEKAFAWLLDMFSYFGVAVAERLIAAEDKSSGAFDRLGRAAVKDVFGVDVGAGAFASRGAAGQRRAAADSLGAAVIRGMFGGLGTTAAGPLQPSSAGAEKAVTLMVSASMEGWLEGWLMEALSLGGLEKFGELDDKLVNALGLGRITSRVMAPAADVLVATPFEWKLNELYRPKLLSPRQAVSKFQRGHWTREKMTRELALQGYSDDRIEALIAEDAKHFTIAELDYMVSRGLMQRGDAMGELVNQGYSAQQADIRLQLAEDQRLDSYRRQVANEAGARFEDRTIDEGTYRRILETSGLPEREQQYSRIVWGLKRELRVKGLTQSQGEAAVQAGLMTLSEYRRLLLDAGYSLADAQTIELLLIGRIATVAQVKEARQRIADERAAEKKAREEAAAKRRAEVEGELAPRAVTLAQFERAVRLGLRSIDEYSAFLVSQGYTLDDAVLLAEVLSTQLDQVTTDRARREEVRRAAARRQVSFSDLETAVSRGLLSIEQYRAALLTRGFQPEDADLLARLLEAEMDDRAEAEAARTRASETLRERDLSLAQIETAVRKGIRSVDAYGAFLAAQGFDADETETLVRLLQLTIAEDTAAREARARIDSTPEARAIPLADFERAVRAGIRTLDEYKGRLTVSGFSEGDIDAAVRLLELDIAQDKATTEARAAAEKRASEKRISLPDLARAVRLGVTTISSYEEGLQRAGIVASDREILKLALLAEIAATREAQARRSQVNTALKAKGLSLSQFERAVLAGLQTVAAYNFWLVSQGFTAIDAATLANLLQLRLDQKRTAEQLRSRVTVELKVRSIALGDFEKAVLEGVRTLPDYIHFLRAQGYSAYDVQTLSALLSGELEEAAAKLAGE